ncbi:hypothetical protein CPAR01_02152 [Colletotrichum paranaense]|uniref:Uncharacterized protein n=3 Tax=Colletotrichum acutatum species complex TaxID=2707335 RepID=A0AAJ0E580_9PEZI|nr:uncharacterized protein CCOS01_03448 [Colletotrichum costaricense]XP_060353768.1 uncharacterized protein CPAR01_02152 [Colletotrichum paranaense]XP_060375337.1 uncharacterized protein CTAM01_14054 [Colletotrichum tamarilloi]KAK1481057.1 hypothetical protein CTAM01_14054 [Colletotrichum tamarilloi]KAK1534696.1 hypothetical protein CCOS01_03448 [Colletotrichum costaricense]KAK1544650.1 hypothetical protein CPAR01_02152 [Colletotrichum paranaense]
MFRTLTYCLLSSLGIGAKPEVEMGRAHPHPHTVHSILSRVRLLVCRVGVLPDTGFSGWLCFFLLPCPPPATSAGVG